MRVLSPAKINLHLRVGQRRGDGFHPLLSWMCTVRLFDTLVFERARSAGVALTSDSSSVPVDQSNLIVRAALVLAAALADSPSANVGGVAIRLEKRIPIGAGLGGGSSNGSRTLLALNAIWNAGWSSSRLAGLAAELGSDLPFFFFGPSGICAGRGERIHPTAPPGPRWTVLVLPSFSISTSAVYRQFDEMGLGRDQLGRDNLSVIGEPNWSHWAMLPADDLLPLLVNDLEPAAFAVREDLGRLRADIEQFLGRVVRMSGSGSSLFTLFDDSDRAVSAADQVRSRHGVDARAVELAPNVIDDLDISPHRA